MLLRFGGLLLILPAFGTVLLSGPVQAQSARMPSAVSVESLPPPGVPSRSVQQQGVGGAPGLPYPSQTDAVPPPPPFASPESNPAAYGHQFDDRSPIAGAPAAAEEDRDAIRPPGVIGAASAAAPQPAVIDPSTLPPEYRPEEGPPKPLPANLQRQLVDYQTKEPAGTIVVDTPNTYLYLVLGHGKALRYGIGVGREGFTWTGTERVSRMKENPDWFPPPEMIARQPYLPRMMAGGVGNPLGTRALYLGHTLYRIHGTNEPSTIGSFVSSGCIRLLNSDIEDLYSRVQVGTRVVVMPGNPPQTAANTTDPGASATKASVMVEPADDAAPVPPSPVAR